MTWVLVVTSEILTMPTYLPFYINQVQAVIYTPEADQFSQAATLATILNRYASRFDGDVQALPLPPNAPSELPRLILTSKDNAFKLQAGPARIDSFWASTPGGKEDDAFSCIEVLDHYLRNTEKPPIIGRVALVITRIADHKNPARELIERFCNAESAERLFGNSESFEIHNHKVYELRATGLRINSWMRCRAVRMIKPEEKNIVLVEQDLNTIGDDVNRRVLDANEIGRFFKGAADEANDTLRKYFPERGA
jgi:hypothetical protein